MSRHVLFLLRRITAFVVVRKNAFPIKKVGWHRKRELERVNLLNFMSFVGCCRWKGERCILLMSGREIFSLQGRLLLLVYYSIIIDASKALQSHFNCSGEVCFCKINWISNLIKVERLFNMLKQRSNYFGKNTSILTMFGAIYELSCWTAFNSALQRP